MADGSRETEGLKGDGNIRSPAASEGSRRRSMSARSVLSSGVMINRMEEGARTEGIVRHSDFGPGETHKIVTSLTGFGVR